MVEPIFDYQFRLILIGNSTVGKSSLLKYFTDGKFAEVSWKFIVCGQKFTMNCCLSRWKCQDFRSAFACVADKLRRSFCLRLHHNNWTKFFGKSCSYEWKWFEVKLYDWKYLRLLFFMIHQSTNARRNSIVVAHHILWLIEIMPLIPAKLGDDSWER